MSLGPGIPDSVLGGAIPRKMHGHKVPSGQKAILGGLHHECRLEQLQRDPMRFLRTTPLSLSPLTA